MAAYEGKGKAAAGEVHRGGLLAAEAVQQLDGLSAFEPEEFFDHGTVEDGDRELAEFLDDAGKVKQPKGLRRQGELSLLATRYHTVVRNEGFPGREITYDNESYRRGNAVPKATVLPQATPTRERVLDPAPGPPPCAAAPDSPQAVRPR